MPGFENLKNNKEHIQGGLLECLKFVASLFDLDTSEDKIIFKLPLSKAKSLTLDMLPRAAKNLGLGCDVEVINFDDIPLKGAPFLLLLKGEQYVVLKSCGKEYANVFFPQKGKVISIPVRELKEHYGGVCAYFSAISQHSNIHDILSNNTQEDWYKDVLTQMKPIFIRVVLCAVFINLFVLVMPLYIMNVYDRVIPNGSIDTLTVLTVGVLLALIFDYGLKALKNYFLESAGKEIDMQLNAKLFSQILNIKLERMPARAGSLSYAVKEFEQLREYFTSTAISALADLPFIFLFIAIIYMLGGSLAQPVLIAVPVIALLSYFGQKPLIKTASETLNERMAKNSLLMETIYGVEAIKASSAEGFFQRQWEKIEDVTSDLNLKARSIAFRNLHLTIFIQKLTTVSVVVLGVYKVAANEMTMGALIACIILASRALAPLAQMSIVFSRLQQSLASFRSLNNFMQAETEYAPDNYDIELKDLKGKIEFTDVTFTYPNAKMTTLRDINFTIKAGEKVGIIGRTGTGKSTILRLLMRMYNPERGQILLDGIDINQLNLNFLRNNFSYHAQEPFLFSGTMKENILLGAHNVDKATLATAINLSGVDKIMNSNPLGLDLWLGEQGKGLSGGQKQTVALARTFLHGGKVMLLDEPTSAMDSQAELEFVKKVKPYVKDKTLIVVSHRLVMLGLVDRLIVLDNGRIVADGDKDTVMKILNKQTGGAS